MIPGSAVHNINVNTLSADKPELLQVLLETSQNDGHSILSARSAEGFKSIDDFFALQEVAKL